MATVAKQQLDIVMVGHVDHGKSTVIGRLLADTGSLPEGKLDEVRARCERNARPFEYAFLLDALKHEQAQGITIDTARCFLCTERRNYILHDAPGHVEFLKNMATGAARADAALLVIDALEGVRENSRRHGYILSMLGIGSLAVLINKMDRVGYSREVYERIAGEYSAFLSHFNVRPLAMIPTSGRDGANIARRADEMPWYQGPSVLEQIEAFTPPAGAVARAFRMPVQDIYKFTEAADDRRIVVGTVESGALSVGDEVVFHPCGKRARVATIESYSSPARETIEAGHATGFTFEPQVYIKPGELACKADEPPLVGTRFLANLFWMGRAPLVVGRRYRLRVGATAVAAQLVEVRQVLDASDFATATKKEQVDRHDVAEVVLEAARPVAFDRAAELPATGRFVIVDDYEIAGCGVVLQPEAEGESVFEREVSGRDHTWEKGRVSREVRAARVGHYGKFIVITGAEGAGKRELARALEEHLFARGRNVYYLGVGNLFDALRHDVRARDVMRDEQVMHLGQVARVMAEAGLLLLSTLADADDFDLHRLARLVLPHELLAVHLGDNGFVHRPPDVLLPAHPEIHAAVAEIERALEAHQVFYSDYAI